MNTFICLINGFRFLFQGQREWEEGLTVAMMVMSLSMKETVIEQNINNTKFIQNTLMKQLVFLHGSERVVVAPTPQNKNKNENRKKRKKIWVVISLHQKIRTSGAFIVIMIQKYILKLNIKQNEKTKILINDKMASKHELGYEEKHSCNRSNSEMIFEIEVNGIRISSTCTVASIYENKDIERRIDINVNSNKRETISPQNIVILMETQFDSARILGHGIDIDDASRDGISLSSLGDDLLVVDVSSGLGATITLAEFLDCILASVDHGAANTFQEMYKKERFKSIDKSDRNLNINVEDGNCGNMETIVYVAYKCLVAIGRVSYTEDVELKEQGIRLDGPQAAIDKHWQSTSHPSARNID